MHRMRKLMMTVQQHRQHHHSCMIQKYLKGYPVAQKFEHVYVKMRLSDNLKHFEDMKLKIKNKAATKIQRWWKSYLANKAITIEPVSPEKRSTA